MIIKCEQRDEERILSYIGADYSSCLYLYLNLKKYGLESQTIEVYLQYEGDRIGTVLLQYYSCLHVYSRDNSFDAEELGEFFLDHGLSMFYCAAETAKIIYSSLPASLYSKASLTTGWVAQIKKIDMEPSGLAVTAEQNDFEQIVKLIYADEDIGKSYKLEELTKQLEERSREGYSRHLVIKQGDLVIAHACTNAEKENIAVVAELLVKEDYRQRGYATEIWRDLCGRLIDEGKEVYSFYYTEESRNLHRLIGFTEVCEWAKVVIA